MTNWGPSICDCVFSIDNGIIVGASKGVQHDHHLMTDQEAYNDAVQRSIQASQQSPAQIVSERIKQYQTIAPQLLVELYTENTLAGITTAQSDQMFDDFQDVLVRIKEGAFPTAIHRLNNKTPNGFVTQDLIDSWKAKVQSYMV